MFDRMLTEPVPARVFELYRVVSSRGSISKNELENLLLPDGLYEDKKPNYINPTLTAAIELELVSVVDNSIVPLVNKKDLKTLDDLRNISNLKLRKYSDGQFYKVTNAVLNMNSKVLEFQQIIDLGREVREAAEIDVSDTEIRGWRFWATFLGFGYMQGMTFLPNAYVFLKSILPNCHFNKGEVYTIKDFLTHVNEYGSILSENNKPTYLNLAFSNGLRQLHKETIIELKHENDQDNNQQLFPMNYIFGKSVTHIEYKGSVK